MKVVREGKEKIENKPGRDCTTNLENFGYI